MIELNYKPYEYQQEFHDSPARFHLIVGGRRVGKSRMALMELIRHCIDTPKAHAWWVAPTIAMAREVGWEEFKELADDLGPVIESIHETLLRVRFINGSVLYFKGADNESSLRGRGLTYLVLDEAAFIDEDAWKRALRPALADRGGKCLLISTPNGRNWFYSQASFAHSNASWEYAHWPTWMNPLISERELQEAAATISEQDFRQEFLAEFVTKEGMVYDGFSEENIIEPGIPSIHDFEVYLGVDFGYANPSAICFMAVDREEDKVIQFAEVYEARRSIDELQDLILLTLKEFNLNPGHVKAIFTDPAGNAEELSSGISPVDFLRQSPFNWTVINKGSDIASGVALVRSYIKAKDGTRRFFVTSNNRETIRSLTGYTYSRATTKHETIKEEPLKDGIHDHMCDAIRYFFVNAFDHSSWLADRPQQYNYGMDMKAKTRPVQKRCQLCKRKFFSRTPVHEPPFTCRDCNQEI